MIPRLATAQLRSSLAEFPAVAILGPRQVGKTTLALELASAIPSVYLDLESPEDRAIAADPAMFLSTQAGKLVIMDEVQRVPELFATLRGVIDRGRRAGRKSGQFLLLGSASRDLLRQSSESLAGRIVYEELTPLLADEATGKTLPQLWLRGGFPESLLATSDKASLTWRRNFINQYMERDIAQLGVRTPTETLRRFWTMLAAAQGGSFHPAQIAASIGLSPNTISSHIDMLCDLMLVRRLQPWFANVGKRLVKAPKVSWRDSGLTHALLSIGTHRDLLSHPILGGSWEAFVVEQLIAAAGPSAQPWYYRTSAGAEIDLLLEVAPARLWAIEIKHSTAPVPAKGFHIACTDVAAERRFVVHTGDRRYTGTNGVEFTPLRDLMAELRAFSGA